MNTSPNSAKPRSPKSDPVAVVGDVTSCRQSLQKALEPVPQMPIWVWADEYRALPSTSAEPGRWRTARVPYMREVMDCLSPHHPCDKVVLMKGAQVGATEIGNNWIGHTVHLNPGLMLAVQPGLSEVKRNTNTRINPLIESTPAIKELVTEFRSREAGNSMFRKSFPGGELIMTGANSAKGLRSTPARFLFLDEVDAYPLDADGEGDPVDLAEQRTVTFQGRRKIYLCSTPTIDGLSRIAKAYDETDQRRYMVPCRACGRRDWLRWENIVWDDEEGPDGAGWVCPDEDCGHKHQEHDKPWLLENGQWEATAEGDGRTVGFHLSALYSPFEPWAAVVRDFLRRKDDPTRFKTWINTKLGETWKEQGDAPEWQHLYARRESYPTGTVPQGGVVLTAGVDVQADRIEVEVVAWGRHNWSWSVDYRVFEGDTGNVESTAWEGVDKLLAEQFSFESGGVGAVRCLAVDDGYNSQAVRDWARAYPRDRVMVVKGQDAAAAPLGLPSAVDINYKGKRLKKGMQVWPVGVSHLKGQLYGWLKLHPPTQEQLDEGAGYPQGFCHFPEYPDEYFQMLTAEILVKRIVKGYPRYEWVKTRTRNEALDCRNYARAACLRLRVPTWGDRKWAAEEKAVGLGAPPTPPPDATKPNPSTAAPPAPASGRRSKRRTRMKMRR